MMNYGPFDKPYGFFTRSGLIERAKAFIVLFESQALLLIAAILIGIGQHEICWLFKFAFLAASTPFLFSGIGLMILGVTWVYFPEVRPKWRKRLTW